jgi:hypothetical protein
LEPSEKATFTRLYGTGERCRKCGSGAVTIRIWEGYASPAKTVGGDLGPDAIVAAVVICADCGHGETVARSDIRRAGKAA